LPIPVDHADTFINQTQDISEALLTIHNASFNIRISNSLVNSFNCTNLAGDTNIIDNGSLKYTPKLNELAFIVKDVLERIVRKISFEVERGISKSRNRSRSRFDQNLGREKEKNNDKVGNVQWMMHTTTGPMRLLQ